MKYDPKKVTVTIGGEDYPGLFAEDIEVTRAEDSKPIGTIEINLTLKGKPVDPTMPEHLYAKSILFCPLCDFRFLRPSANVATGHFENGYQIWHSFYRCPCCALYFVEWRCMDPGLDALTRSILVIGSLPWPQYSQETFELNNQAVLKASEAVLGDDRKPT